MLFLVIRYNRHYFGASRSNKKNSWNWIQSILYPILIQKEGDDRKFFREGRAFCRKALGVSDHDFNSFADGIVVSHMLNEEDLFSGFMDTSVYLFAKDIPMYYARGNHETRGTFATFFQNYFSPKKPYLYYLVRQGPVCFVVLDTGEDKPDSDLEYSGITDYDILSDGAGKMVERSR